MKSRILKCFALLSVITTGAIAILVTGMMMSLSLEKWTERGEGHPLSTSLKEEIREDTKGCKSAEDVADYSIGKTTEMLRFSTVNDVDAGKANCIGYARLCASIYNYAVQCNGMSGNAKPVTGTVRLLGLDMCKLLRLIASTPGIAGFVKDHDFVEFHAGEEHFYADPSLKDLFFVSCETYL